MSEVFWSRFLSFFWSFILVLFLVLGSFTLLQLWINYYNLAFYYGYVAFISLAGGYGIKAYQDYRYLKGNLDLFVPDKTEKPLEPLNVETEDVSLKVCVLYRNGATLESMKKDFGFSHPYQVRRKLIEGLDILLKEHKGGMKT